MTTNLNDIAKQIHENAKSKGFYDEPRNTGELFMLMVSELGEAMDADRKGKRADMAGFTVTLGGLHINQYNEGYVKWAYDGHIKGSIEEELADAVIRIMDFCAFYEINIDIVEYEQHGDFEVSKDCNFGEELMDVNRWLCRAFYEDSIDREPCLNAAVILLINLSLVMGFDLMQHIELKMKYNATREHKHGKKY